MSKPEYIFTASPRPGPCTECRHANQGTVDFAEGHLFCGRAHATRTRAATCDVTVKLPRRAGAPQAEWGTYYLFERFDGQNAVAPGGFNADVRAPDSPTADASAKGPG